MAQKKTSSDYAACVQGLLKWFTINKEPHPWRIKSTSYGVWISEIMLQQTTIAAVTDYYIRWMRRFPTMESLAHTQEQEVLRQWEGLGYYSRARNLHKTAQLLSKEGKALPENYKELLKLPGIGPYTAAAISSIAFGLPYPVIDGNIKRILCRIFLWPQWDKEAEAQASDYLNHWIKLGPAGDFNEAMMELGQKICSKATSQCGLCPFEKVCQACEKKQQNEIPLAKSTRLIHKKTSLILCVHENQLLMTEKKEGLLKGLWIFPSESGHEISRSVEWLNSLTLDFQGPHPLKKHNHLYTKYKDQLQPLVFRVNQPFTLEEKNGRWIPLNQIDDFPMASVYRKIVGQLVDWLKKNPSEVSNLR